MVGDLAAAVSGDAAREGVCFHSVGGDQAFVIDPVPRVIGADEWAGVEAGLIQRVRALNAFVADVYGPRRIVEAGIVPERVIETAEYHEPQLRGQLVPGDVWIGVAGLDVVRDHSGSFLVLEDNVRTPSGYAYACAARRALATHLEPGARGRPAPARRAHRHAGGDPARGRARADGDPRIVVLTDGEHNSAYYEHEWIAGELGVPLVVPDQLELRDSSSGSTASRSTSSTAAPTPTASTPRSAGCCSSRGARARSASPTPSAPASPTTSSPTPTSRT